MICTLCFHPCFHLPHVCLVHTCPSCFSPKDFCEMYCSSCKTSPPCEYCQYPSKFQINNINLCISHVKKTCEVDKTFRTARRRYKNKKYEESCAKTKETRKLGRPRLSALWKITNLRLRTGLSE